MPLNHDQKKYIKKHLKDSSIEKIADFLNTDQKLIEGYIKKRWGEEKLSLEPQLTPVSTTSDHPTSKSWFFHTRIHILILIVLVFIVYANSLDNAFLSDDLAEIVQKPEIANFSRIFEFPFGPIRHIIYWVAFHIGGLSPFIFRFTNILLHVGSILIAYFILLRMLKSTQIAFFATSLFAVSPVIMEGVTWISGGMYPQYSLFFLLSFLFYLKSDKKIKNYLLSIIFYLLSFMSHYVMPAGLVIIYPLYELCFGNFKKNWVKALPFFAIFIFYFFFNLSSIPQREATLQNVHYQERGTDNIFVILPVAISNYFQLFIWPQNLTLYHSELHFTTPEFIIRIIILLVYLVLIAISFFRNKIIFFWASFFLLALAPTLTPFRLNWIVAERYVYLGSIGLFVIVAYLLNKLTQLKKIRFFVYFLFIIIILASSVRTIVRNIDWHNEDNLWIATGKTSPSSPNTHNNLGDVYGRWGDKERSLQEFLYAIQLKPNYADAYHNAGNVYRELGQLDKALESYQKAADLNPYLWQSYQNIAAIYFMQNKFDQALQNIQKAIEINPQNLNLRGNLGITYMAKGDKEKARETFKTILAIDPQNQLAKAGLVEANK